MAPSSSSTSRGTFLFATAVVIGVVAYVAYVWNQEATKGKASKASKAAKAQPSSSKKALRPAVEVTDDDDDDDEDEEDEEIEDEEVTAAKAAKAAKDAAAAEEAKRQKELYDNCISVAEKCVKGNDHARAVQKYTEALELAPFVPSASNKIPTIYNNRSAMYEKLGQFPQSLNDIDVLLVMDPLHVKARTRRARIYEAQDRLEDSMHEYCTAMVAERHRAPNAAPTSNHEQKIADLSKLLSAKRAGPILATIRSSSGRDLPTSGYCRNFFDVLPSTHRWRATLSSSNPSSSSSGSSSSGNGGTIITTTSSSSNKGLQGLTDALASIKEGSNLRAAVDLACCAIADGKFKLAFKTLAAVRDDEATSAAGVDDELTRYRSLRLFLEGLERHLRCNLEGALKSYRECIAMDVRGVNFEAKLALASAHRELGEEVKAEELYAEVLQQFAGQLVAAMEQAGMQQQAAVVAAKEEASAETKGGEKDKVLEDGEVDESAASSPTTTLESTSESTSSNSDAASLPAEKPAPLSRFQQYLKETAHGGVPSDPSLRLADIADELIATVTATASTSNSTASTIVNIAWALIHRHSMWTMRNAQGSWRAEALTYSQQDLSLIEALLPAILKSSLSEETRSSATMAQVLHYIKQITMNSQTKMSVGSVQMTDEDKDQCKEYVRKAKILAPTHESVMVLESDMLSMDERLDEALVVISKMIERADAGDGVPYVINANIVAQKAIQLLSQVAFEHDPRIAAGNSLIQESEQLYEKALEVEPNCVEALAQSAQLKILLGKVDEAADLISKALPLSRSREEVQELGQMLGQANAQLSAIKTVQAAVQG